MAADALRISSSSSGSLVCNLNGSQRRPVLLPLSSHRATFLGLPPRASSSSISSSIPLGTSRIGLGSSKLSHRKKNFSLFAVAEVNSLKFGLETEDYLTGNLFYVKRFGFAQPRYVVNRETTVNYDCPRKVMNFLT